MAVPSLLRCAGRSRAALHGCSYATLGRPSRPGEKGEAGTVFQYVGKHKKANHKVFVWGFSFTGALGIPSFVVPDSGRKKPRKYQLTPYRLDTAEKVRLPFRTKPPPSGSNATSFCGFCPWQISSAACGYGFTLIASHTKDVTKLWGMGLNKDSQLGFQRTQQSRRKNTFHFRRTRLLDAPLHCCFSAAGSPARRASFHKSPCLCSSQLRLCIGALPGGPTSGCTTADPSPSGILWPSSFAGPHRR